MSVLAVGSILAASLLDWLAVAYRCQRVKYITKPLALALLILWVSLADGWRYPLLLFTLGALFSLAGDICLMLPGRFFLYGLFAFLIAHFCYTAGFIHDGLPGSLLFYLLIVLTVVIAVIVTRKIRHGVNHTPGTGHLKKAVTLYSVAITVMFLSAISTVFMPAWEPQTSLLAALGGLLFYFSDSLLAYDRFVIPVKNGRLLVRISYHLGQLFLLWGAVRHFSL